MTEASTALSAIGVGMERMFIPETTTLRKKLAVSDLEGSNSSGLFE